MEAWEIVCFTIWILSFLIGYYIGFTNMLARVVATILSAFVVYMMRDWAFAFLFRWALFEGDQRMARIVVIILAIVIMRILLHLVMKTLGLVGRLPGLRKLNRFFGGLVGLMEGTAVLLVIRFVFKM